jgi:hypothetical protein
MCSVCGQMFCPPSCPEYDPKNDPLYVGRFCKACGCLLEDEEGDLCYFCEEDLENGEVDIDDE